MAHASHYLLEGALHDTLLMETGDAYLIESMAGSAKRVALFQDSLSQGVSGQHVVVLMVDETDGEQAETGVTSPTIELLKYKESFETPSDGTWEEIGYGYYYVTLNDLDTNTLGRSVLRITASGCAETIVFFEVAIEAAEKRTTYQRLRALHRDVK